MEKLSSKDLLLIACALYPDIDREIIKKMIKFNKKVSTSHMYKHTSMYSVVHVYIACLQCTVNYSKFLLICDHYTLQTFLTAAIFIPVV